MIIDERALTQSLRELAALFEEPAVTLSDQLNVVVGAAADLLNVDCVGILLLDDSDHVRTVAASGPTAAALERAQEHLQLGPGIDALSEERVLAVTDLATDPVYRRLWPQLAGCGVRAVLSAPVVVRNEVVGNLNAVTGQRHSWSAAERRAGAAFAGLIGQLLHAATSSQHPVEATWESGPVPERETEDPGT